MKPIDLNSMELEKVVGGGEGQRNLGKLIGYTAQKISDFVGWLFTPTSGSVTGNWSPYPGMGPGSMGLK